MTPLRLRLGRYGVMAGLVPAIHEAAAVKAETGRQRRMQPIENICFHLLSRLALRGFAWMAATKRGHDVEQALDESGRRLQVINGYRYKSRNSFSDGRN